MKIATYSIAKNEAKFAARFVSAVRDADLVLVADTGSNDGTPQMLLRRGAWVIDVSHTVQPFRFDTALNIAMDSLPDDIDVCVSLDLDDVPRPGWRSAIEEAWTPGVTGLRYLYVTSHNPDGSDGVAFHADKIHSRHGHRWKYPVHEVLESSADGRRETCAMIVDHFPDDSKSRAQYLGLLELAAKEEPSSHRAAFYLGREYMYRGRWEECIAELKRYLLLPTATWNVERCAAYRWIGHARKKLDDFGAAECALKAASREAPGEREPWVDLANLWYDAKALNLGVVGAELILSALHKALAITVRPGHHCTEAYAWGNWPATLLNICEFELGARR